MSKLSLILHTFSITGSVASLFLTIILSLLLGLFFIEHLPKLSSNSIYPMAECFLSLYWNSTTDNYSVQLSC